MQLLGRAGLVFAVLAALCLLSGAAGLYMRAEAADNLCDDGGLDPCRGRDARVQGFQELGQFLLWGGFFVLALSAGMLVLASRRVAE